MPLAVRNTFGDEDLMRLLGHFCNEQRPVDARLFDVGGREGIPRVKEEFRHLKAKLAWQAELGRSWDAAYADVCSNRCLFPRVLQLVCVASVLPTQTACVERGFSRHRLVKTRLSSRKRVVTVDAELRVGLLGRPADASAGPLVEAAAVLHAAKNKGIMQKLHAAVSGIDVNALGSDADDSEDGSDVASVGSEDSDASLTMEGDEELYSSSGESGPVSPVLEGSMGIGQALATEPTEEELRMLGCS